MMRGASKDLPWTGDPTGDVANAHCIPEDAGVCLLCFGDRKVTLDYKTRKCPLCKGSGVQTPELVRAYRNGELALDYLTTLA